MKATAPSSKVEVFGSRRVFRSRLGTGKGLRRRESGERVKNVNRVREARGPSALAPPGGGVQGTGSFPRQTTTVPAEVRTLKGRTQQARTISVHWPPDPEARGKNSKRTEE